MNNNMKEYYAIRLNDKSEDNKVKKFLQEELKNGRLRQGWSWLEEQNPLLLKEKNKKNLTEDEKNAYSNIKLLDIKKEDIVVVPNFPDDKNISFFKKNKNKFEYNISKDFKDYGNILGVDCLITIEKCNNIIKDKFRKTFTTQGRMWNITRYKDNIEKILEYFKKGLIFNNEFLENCLIIFDTNIFLNLFGTLNSKQIVKKILEFKEKNRFFITETIKNEINIKLKDRSKERIKRTIPELSFETDGKSIKNIKYMEKEFFEYINNKNDINIEKLKNFIDEKAKKRKEKLEKNIKIVTDEIFKLEPTFIFTNKEKAVLKNYFDFRILEKISTPGSEDCKKNDGSYYNDFIIFNECIEYSKKYKKNLMFVTEDFKEVEKNNEYYKKIKKEFKDESGYEYGLVDFETFKDYYNINISEEDMEIIKENIVYNNCIGFEKEILNSIKNANLEYELYENSKYFGDVLIYKNENLYVVGIEYKIDDNIIKTLKERISFLKLNDNYLIEKSKNKNLLFCLISYQDFLANNSEITKEFLDKNIIS